jgi:4-hydroxybenzoate polyprenyltransferase/phosphoserine phosphatase
MRPGLREASGPAHRLRRGRGILAPTGETCVLKTPPAPAKKAAASVAPKTPLVVDLDGTLIKTDTLFEAFAESLRARPLKTALMLLKLPLGIAPFKAAMMRGHAIDLDVLPLNDEVLAYVRDEKAKGRPVWLASAADQSIVDAIAARVGLFDRAIGSDGKVNNKGARKAELLESLAPNGFEYIGDSNADMKVWAKASAAAHVGGGETRKRQLEQRDIAVTASFKSPNQGLKAWRKALRLHQWAKNAMLFVAPILGLRLFDVSTFLAVLAGFVCMGVMASGAYLLNDLLDLSADRRHHSKRLRPFAAGRLPLVQGLLAAPALMLGGLIGGALISPLFGVTMAIYLVTTLAYSFGLKRVPLFDTMILAFLFTIRLIMGGVLAGVAVTQWLLVFSMFLFFSLSLAKRHVEVLRKAEAGITRSAGRGYEARDASLTLGLGLASATATPVILALYIIGEAGPSGLYHQPQFLWGAPVMLTMWLCRVWLLANRAELDDDPVSFAVKDPLSLAIGVGLAAFFAAAAFLPAGVLPF